MQQVTQKELQEPVYTFFSNSTFCKDSEAQIVKKLRKIYEKHPPGCRR